MSSVSKEQIDLLPHAGSGAAQLRCQLLSLGLHALAALLIASPGIGAFGGAVTLKRAHHDRLDVMLVPPPLDIRQKADAKPGTGNQPILSPPVLTGGSCLDLTGLKLAIAPDPGFELVRVLAAHHGLIGFADPHQPGYLSHLFAAPDWHRIVLPGLVSADDFFTIRIDQPESWPLIQHVRSEYGLTDETIVYALLPPQFHDQVLDLIRRKAMQLPSPARLTAARIAFDASSPAGVTVTDLTLQPTQ